MSGRPAQGLIRVRPVLFCAPVFWTPDFWTKETHRWDWVDPQTPLDEKPWAELEISLDVTLGEVMEAACDAWGIESGRDQRERGFERQQQFVRFAFVSEATDAEGVEPGVGYRWPWSLPIAAEDGTVGQRPAKEVTYRELLAASELGLIEGDVTRPYVHPVPPQGEPGALIEAGRLTLQAIRAVYQGIDDSIGYAEHTLHLIRASAPRIDRAVNRTVNPIIDEGVRIAAVAGFVRWLRRKRRRSRSNTPSA
jgi:hypothetical protein